MRLPYDQWRNLQNDLADRMNLTPLQDQAYPDLPAQGPVQELNPYTGDEMKLSDLYDTMADEAVSEIMNSADSIIVGEGQLVEVGPPKLHAAIHEMHTGNEDGFFTGADALDLTAIRDEYKQAAATMQDSLSTWHTKRSMGLPGTNPSPRILLGKSWLFTWGSQHIIGRRRSRRSTVAHEHHSKTVRYSRRAHNE